MQVQCPKCGYTGQISDKLIPDGGRNVKCPKCSERFFIEKSGVHHMTEDTYRPPPAVEPTSPDTGMGGRNPAGTYRPPAGTITTHTGGAVVRNKSFIGAIIAGSVAAFVCSIIWAVITVLTGYQVGLMAIGVGLFVGIGVGAFGDGEDFTFGIIGATLSLFGCLFGNLLSICAFISRDPRNPSFFTVLFDVISHFDKLKSVFAAHFQLIDLLFYAIAVVAGFKVSTGVDFDKDSD